MDSTSSYFTDDLDLEMFKTSMSPLTPTLDSKDQFGTSNEMSWNLNGDFSYSPDAYFGEESYDYFGYPSEAGTLSAAHAAFDAGFGMKSTGNDLMDWSTTVGTTAPTYTVPLAPSSTTYSTASYLSSPEVGSFNDEFISPAVLGTETDNESLTSSKRGADDTSAASASDSSRPTKKQCSSKASSSSKASTTKAPKEKTTSKSKSKSKSSSKTPSPSAAASSTSGHGGNHNIQLRTASRKPKSPTSSTTPVEEDDDDEDGLTNEEKRARNNHNAVEKQYRNRLNMQFERLLAVLPADQQAEARDRHHIKGGSANDVDDKRMSKAEVLDMARRRIRALEEERRALQEERKGLIENVSEMQRAVVRQRMQMVG